MVHKQSDNDPQARVHASLQELHIKFDQMLAHLATIAGAVKAPGPNLQTPPSPSSPESSGASQT
jgi:hypothetical protein